MAVALVLLAGAAGAPTREHLSSKAGVLVPNQLSGDEGAAEHTTRSHQLASSDESRGAKGISIADARPHDLERRDNTPADERCSLTVGSAATCPAVSEDRTCNRHYCAPCRARAPARTPQRPASGARRVCVARVRRLHERRRVCVPQQTRSG